MSNQLTDEQSQELMDAIANICGEMELEPEQILDGIARSLMGACSALGTANLTVSVDNFGQCEVKLLEHAIAE
ncbi:hypothetical protein MHM98_06795 [Psychrobium sp. MM17-31]|uniref:hypothetical protein n=1 Tax=Psychrobium sp. MM17-31 TaxID=2917758 RepID=UPI001EF6970B|nr:hypothetical protein [Psychrobium sp. MM17-31]MCG7531056.1 hypothetical protein [Psychrobium sp. MM17-31]